MVIWAALFRHIGSPSLGTGFPRLTEKLSQLSKGGAVEDALTGKEVPGMWQRVAKSGSDQQRARSHVGEG
jgi:hypothetical protein